LITVITPIKVNMYRPNYVLGSVKGR
jgi:hypothetical protein